MALGGLSWLEWTLFKFLVEHQDKRYGVALAVKALHHYTKWQDWFLASAAAIHRLSRITWISSPTLTRAALSFTLCIGGLSSVRKLRRLSKFLEDGRSPKVRARRTRSRNRNTSAKLAQRLRPSKV
ncbi:hypothetical protein HAV15_011073 [Penicillium sp. str. |nr:hypothetical protein HAV15_011073 [Penicillium sp. str. \